MATTLQASNRNTAGATLSQKSNPQMKRLVYSKYRELLGSYNNQAQAYIDTLPDYMVHRDNGFNLNDNSTIITNAENKNFNEYNETSHGYGQGMSATRPMQEAPACVQNAMMTKDKKPFTYTPGGIDLSQIKSERMAKRLARNAQAEGVVSQRSPQPPSPNSVGSGSGSATASMGAAALGMPFQVLPSPPPPPPPSVSGTLGKHANGNAVQAPPPPPPTSLLHTQNFNNSPNTTRKASPSNFQPPPIGFRPEIKIPPNPIAALRKVPPPMEKNDFWKEEYVREHSKSPLPDTQTSVGCTDPSNDITDALKNTSISATGQQYSPNNSHNTNNFSHDQNMLQQPKQQQQQQGYNPTPSIQVVTGNKTPQPYISPSPASAEISPKIEFRSVAPPQTPQTASPYTNEMNNIRGEPPQNPFKFNQQQQQQQPISPTSTKSPSATVSAVQSVPWRNPRANQQQSPPQQQTMSAAQPIYNNVQQQYQQQQQSNQFNNQDTKPTNVGSLYIAPLTPTNEPQGQHMIRQQQQQQTQQQQQKQSQPPVQQLRWLSSQPVPREQPEWARAEENGNVVPSSINRIKSPPPPPQPISAPLQMQQQQQYNQMQRQDQIKQQQQSQYNNNTNNSNVIYMNPTMTVHTFGGGNQGHATTGLRLQINNTTTNQANTNNSKERIIPIQLEQTPPTTQTTSNVTFNTNSSAPGYIIRSPNQFVDQGYNNYAGSSNINPSRGGQQLNAPRMVQQQQLQQQQHQQHNQNQNYQYQQTIGGPKTHIIPITIEGNSPGTRGPISKTPVIIPNDHRNSSPIQSKSFRILQKITDTDNNTEQNEKRDNNNNNDSVNINYVNTESAQLQKPHYARQMSAQQAHHTPNWDKVKSQCSTEDIHEQQQQQQGNYKQVENYNQSDEMKKYTGNSIPSRSFKILQAMTTPENVGPGQSDL